MFVLRQVARCGTVRDKPRLFLLENTVVGDSETNDALQIALVHLEVLRKFFETDLSADWDLGRYVVLVDGLKACAIELPSWLVSRRVHGR